MDDTSPDRHEERHFAVGQRIREFREKRGMSRMAAARSVEMSDSYWGSLERGLRRDTNGQLVPLHAGFGTILQVVYALRLTSGEQEQLFDAAGITAGKTVDLPPRNELLRKGAFRRQLVEGGLTAEEIRELEDEATAARLELEGKIVPSRRPRAVRQVEATDDAATTQG